MQLCDALGIHWGWEWAPGDWDGAQTSECTAIIPPGLFSKNPLDARTLRMRCSAWAQVPSRHWNSIQETSSSFIVTRCRTAGLQTLLKENGEGCSSSAGNVSEVGGCSRARLGGIELKVHGEVARVAVHGLESERGFLEVDCVADGGRQLLRGCHGCHGLHCWVRSSRVHGRHRRPELRRGLHKQQ